MVSRSNKEQIQMQQELAEENCKAQKEMADAHSRDMLLLTQQLLSSQEKWLLASAIKLHKKELSAWIAKKDTVDLEMAKATIATECGHFASQSEDCKRRIQIYKKWLVDIDHYYLLTSPLAPNKHSNSDSDNDHVDPKVQHCL